MADKAGALVQRFRKTGCDSFTPDTEVVMADGTTKPIAEVELGDEVLATGPETDRSGTTPLTGLITGEGAKKLVRTGVDTDGDAGDRTAPMARTTRPPS
ncbi:hypothetical protein ACIBQ1_20480 [Nonomuraea sp. NPDC050153]|uniref:hypothetical protein n=1 Tax=Nonomuraea sp. NPDC050153 TaxID=3364359 RepID=UPI0037B83E79